MLTLVLFASLLVMLVSFSGKLVTIRGLGALIERHLHFFVSFAAGVLIVVAYNLTQELVEHAGSLTIGLPWIAIGAVVVLIAFKYVPNYHHHHEKGEHKHSSIDANRILFSDAIHNIGDGIVIVVSFAASTVLGVASTISIMVHELLQEISEYFVLREAGLNTRVALLLNFTTSATILFGAIGAYFLLERFEALEVPLLGLSIGSYLVVVFHDLIPHSLSSAVDRHHLLRHALFFAVGAALMYAIITILPHGEPEEIGNLAAHL